MPAATDPRRLARAGATPAPHSPPCYEAADRALAADLREAAARSALGQCLLALVIAAAVDRWIRLGRSGQRVSEIWIYGHHGGVGWGGALAPVDLIDECFRRHDRAYDEIEGA